MKCETIIVTLSVETILLLFYSIVVSLVFFWVQAYE